ncbi:adenosylcobinamide-GDP ribazoletransferase, partial [Micromonospora sp. NPDC047753]|uniref:adenosylcobinamide-GDP ribazoletransferase n=1 Tax=Micromonospora sp. NPDC047753 TaxID=3154817 RepID=UPI00340B1C05
RASIQVSAVPAAPWVSNPADLGGGGQPVQPRHPDVQQRHPGAVGTIAGTVGPVAVAAGAVAVVLLAVPAVPGRPWQGPLAVVAATAVALPLLNHVVRRLGGITGDVLGATVEVVTTLVYLGLVLSG